MRQTFDINVTGVYLAIHKVIKMGNTQGLKESLVIFVGNNSIVCVKLS